MKSKFFIPPILLAAAIMITSCNKETQPPATSTPFAYTSLKSQSDTIFVGETTTVTATATGSNLAYNWELTTNPQGGGSLGDIIGNGATVTYGASPCCTGWNTITCTVSDGLNSQSKSVTIVVREQ